MKQAADPGQCSTDAKERHQAELDSLEDVYYQDEFNSVLHELQKLPAYFTKDDLDTVVDARASVMEVQSPCCGCWPHGCCPSRMKRHAPADGKWNSSLAAAQQ